MDQEDINTSCLLLQKIISSLSLISYRNAAHEIALSIHLSGGPTTALEPISQL